MSSLAKPVHRTSVDALAVGIAVATMGELLLCIPFVRKAGYQHVAIVDFRDRDIKAMLLITLPVILGTAVNDINVLVDRNLASRIAVGGISALNYAGRVSGLVKSLFVVSVTTVMYPTISKMAARGMMGGFRGALSEAISMVALFVVPATAGLLIFSREIVEFLFARGAFVPEAVSMTTSALFFYSIGMTGDGLRYVLGRAFYSLQDTRTPVINATMAVGMNIVLNIVLSRFLGVGGLALATSISSLFSAFLMFITLRKRIGRLGIKDIAVSFSKISIASFLMGLFARGIFTFLADSFVRNTALLVSIFVGAVVYGVLVYLMRVREVERMVQVAKERLRRVATQEGIRGK